MLRWQAMRISGLFATVALGAALSAVACGSLSDSAFADGAPSASDAGGSEFGDRGGGSAPAADLAPTDNGVILVHAAGMPAFRLCFENELARLPVPDSTIMPEANVVGVEVGSAVRIEPLKGAPGKIWVFEEPVIRDFAGKGPTCQALLSNPTLSAAAHELPAVTADLSHGVHLLVVRGCVGKSALRSYTKAECGEDYDENEPHGNLAVLEKELEGAKRTGDALPTQVVHLSRALETARGERELEVSFGDVTAPDAPHASVASGPELFGAPLDLASPPTFDASDESVYAKVGFRVSITGGADPPTVVTQQTLADVQGLSAPREVPTTYYAAASNYVLLLLGDPAPKTSDGGADDDALRNVHLLAVPVIESSGDAGDAGASDAGPAPDGGSL